MRVFVLLKQVPGTANVKMDEKTGTMVRTENENVINPLDENALEEALRIAHEHPGSRVIALSMGPPPAAKALREAVAMGADEAYLLSDRGFSAADTLATAKALAKGIEKAAGGHLDADDLILCGERATDGETGQVGPMIAGLLDVTIATYVARVQLEQDTSSVVAERVVEDGFERLRLSLPAVLTVVKDINQPGFPTLAGKLRAKQAQIPVLTPDDLGIDRSEVGLAGSPTRVVNVFRPKFARNTVLRTQDAGGAAVGELIAFLRERDLA